MAGSRHARRGSAADVMTHIHRSRRWALPLSSPGEVALGLQRLVQAGTNTRDLAYALIVFVKEHSGCETVGIRLREGVGLPYVEIRGFPGRFVQLESDLCVGDPAITGTDPPGGGLKPHCLCGDVIAGRFDPGKPYFTQRGSFWTNSTAELLAQAGGTESPAGRYSRCVNRGHESLALIPLKVGSEDVGLLLLGDRRNGFFSAEVVRYWETLADLLAVSLANLRSDVSTRTQPERRRTLADSGDDLVCLHGVDGGLLEVNSAGPGFIAYSREELLWSGIDGLCSADTAQRFQEAMAEVERRGRSRFRVTLVDRLDRPVRVEVSSQSIDYGGRPMVLSIMHALDGPRSSPVGPQDNEQRFRTLLDTMSEGFAYCQMLYDDEGHPRDWVYLMANEAFATLTGLADVTGMKASEVSSDSVRSSCELLEVYGRVAATGRPEKCEVRCTLSSRTLEVAVSGLGDGYLFAVFNDVTEQRAVEAQLRQSQKMEAVGRLAGGIAHDFNNLLTAVLGYSDLALTSGETIPESVRASIQEIRGAAERATVLTRQILAFSRRQVLRPRVVCLNDVLQGMESLLRRALGEDIDLIFSLADDLAPCMVDPGQMEQVLMNLAVNARDAMPKGGSLTVETTNVNLTRRFVVTHPEITPGPHVLLAVSDSGCGMDRETLSHMFEPFFTTKEPGEGTGLGLATVFGIIKQSAGGISVYSEPGVGTSFKIYLPQTTAVAQASRPQPAADVPERESTGTVLVVDDEPSLRALISRILKSAGYQVIDADSKVEADGKLQAQGVTPDLLLTDMVLQGSDEGRALAEALRERFPHLRVIYMSGYRRDSMVNSGRLDCDVEFLEKPFNGRTLLEIVGRVLKAPRE